MKAVFIALNTIVAVLVAYLLNIWLKSALSATDQYLIGLLIFVALTGAEALWIAGETRRMVKEESARQVGVLKVWESRSEIDNRLQEVRRMFHDLQERRVVEDELFYKYHDKKLSDLESSLRDASSKLEIQIDETMFSVTLWLMHSSFRGRDGDVFRAVLPTGAVDFFFDIHPHRYFDQMLDLIRSGSAKGVRRLLVVDDKDHLSDERVQRLALFHQQTPKYAIRAINRPQYDRVMRDYKLHDMVIDYGVYGIEYVYKGLKGSSDEIIGIYSRDPTEIGTYTECFDSCWEAGYEVPVVLKSAVPVTSQWVFDSGP